MRKWAPRFLSSIIILCATPVGAQDCAAILKDGLWQTWDRSGDFFQREDFKNWACDNKSVGGQGSYGGGQGSFNYGSSNCSTADKTLQVSSQEKESLKTAAEAIVSAWKDCVQGRGSHAILLQGGDINSFFIQLTHRQLDPSRVERPRAYITFDPSDNAACAGMSASQLARGIPLQLLACHRNDIKKPVNVAVNFTLGEPQPLTLRAVQRFKDVFRFERVMPNTDCGLHDIPNRCSVGDTPSNPYCDANHLGLVAICFIPGLNGNTYLPSRPTPECRAQAGDHNAWCTYKDVADCRGGSKAGPTYRCVRALVPED